MKDYLIGMVIIGASLVVCVASWAVIYAWWMAVS